jgi:peptidoglycan biosynthesis protein MviN/MurJ (putative lipid II flippase)
MFVVVFFWFFWKFGGFLINLLIARLYGDSALVKDVYTFTYKWVIFALIYPSLLKVLVPAFMPLFTERMQASEESAWELANTLINIFVALNTGMLCLGMLFSGKLVQTLAPGFDLATQQAAAHALRIMFPGIFAMNMCILALAVQNAYKVFSYPSAGDAVQKIVWAIAILFGAKALGVQVDAIA